MWPQHRPPHLPLPTTLAAAWSRSRETFQELSALIESNPHPAIRCIAVSGSIGRMEQLPPSDADLIIVVENDTNKSDADDAWKTTWQSIAPLGLASPLRDGIFGRATTAAELADTTTRGVIAEDPGTFGRRIQWLLDCQPLHGHDTFDQILLAVLNRFDDPHAPHNRWSYLIDELIRYHRALSVSARWEYLDRPGKWRTRSAKFRHSRLLNNVGLLALLGQSPAAPPQQLLAKFRNTPLERITAAATKTQIDSVLAAYETFLATFASPESLHSLESPTSEPAHPALLPEYTRLAENADTLHTALSEILLALDRSVVRQLLI